MSANKCVIVLAPNGRRQTVKVTPNTTILQILEEVCAKHGFKPEEYDIKHHNHVLDTTSIMRFSGLPNNAQLEMAKSRKIREESSVVLGLQLESGARVMDNFFPTASLWHVINKLCPDEADPNSNPVIIYMRQEVCGMQDLEGTTLRSLGLTGGRAMLRFLHRTPEELHHQANVSGPLPQRPIVNVSHLKEIRTPKSDKQPEHTISKSEMQTPFNPAMFHIPSQSLTSGSVTASRQDLQNSTNSCAHTPQPDVVLSVNNKDPSKDAPMLTSTEIMDVDSDVLVGGLSGRDSLSSRSIISSAVQSTDTKSNPLHGSEEEILLLGERNAIVFSLSMAQSVPYEDLPDDFFDLTLEDARALYRDLKRKRAEMADTPLITRALKELDESKRVLNQLHQYRRAVLRVQFQDRTVLQGTFTPLETVSTVMEFVRGYLDDPEIEFYLYTTPPKCVLAPQARLVDANCVPSALVHFGTDTPVREGAYYLREELHTRFTSPSAAAIAACHSRGLVPGIRPYSAPVSVGSQSRESQAAGTSQEGVIRYQSQGGPNSKVPKWFKPGK